MNRTIIALCVVLTCNSARAGALQAASKKPVNPYAGDKAALQEGGRLFRQMCVGCHGARGRGGKGPDLTDTRWLHGSTDNDLFQVIRKGVRGTTMKQQSVLVTDEKIWKMIAFIRSLARAAGDPGWQPYVPGDPIAGKKIFFDPKSKASCIKCHRIQGDGGKIGPSLTLIAAQRSPKYLMESLLLPSADIDPNFESVLVMTNAGKVIQGVKVNEDNFSIQLRDQETGRLYSFFRNELADVQVQKKSSMPDNLGDLVTVQQLHDLFAYMMTLGGDAKKQKPKIPRKP